MFEKAFGMKFQGFLKIIQTNLRMGIPKMRLEMIDELERTSLIREYCECTNELRECYNRVMEKYANHLEAHGLLILNNVSEFLRK